MIFKGTMTRQFIEYKIRSETSSSMGPKRGQILFIYDGIPSCLPSLYFLLGVKGEKTNIVFKTAPMACWLPIFFLQQSFLTLPSYDSLRQIMDFEACHS